MKEKVYVIMYQSIIMLGTLLVMKLLTNYLEVEEFGIYSLILSAMALIAILPFNSVSQANIRYFSIYQKKKKTPEFIYVTIKWFVIFAAFYFFVFFIGNFFLEYDLWLLSLVYFLVITEVAKTSLRGLVNSARLRKNIAVSGLFEFSVKLALIALVNRLSNLDVYWVIAIFVSANVISIIPLFNKLFRNAKNPGSKVTKIFESRFFWFAIPLVIWGAFGWARDMSNRWYLEWFVDTDSVAIFTVLTSIALILPTAIQSLVNAYYIPILYQQENKHPGYTAKFMNKFAVIFTMIIALSAILLYAFSIEVVIFFSSEAYANYAPALPWMMSVYAVYILSSIMAIEVFAAKKTAYLLVPNIIPGVISIILGYFMIKEFGLSGAFYSYVITYLIFATLMFITIVFFRKREYRFERNTQKY